MLPEFIHNLKKIFFTSQPTSTRNARSFHGAATAAFTSKNVSIEIQHYQKPLFDIRYILTQMINKISFRLKENQPGIRLEAVLTGELIDASDQEQPRLIRAGEYRLSDQPEFIASFKKNSACSYFVTRYSRELLNQIGISSFIKPCEPRFLSLKMNELIQSVLHNNDESEHVRDLHFENCVRELLFLHLTDTDNKMPGNLSDEYLSGIFTADSILRENLQIHHAIPALAIKAGLSDSKLKKGFRIVYKMGVFERLTWHRMEHAKVLLRTTDRTIDDIAEESGYSSRTNFITAFKKIHAVTPKSWRNRDR